MNQTNADIELIRKYFNGELSPADQYELEKRALDDPFLQDAMDGFEQISVNQNAFEALNNRLAERLKKKEKFAFIWGVKQWSIAASVIFGIAVISIYFNQIPENKVIAVSEIQKKERLPKSVKILEDTFAKADDHLRESLVGNNQNIARNEALTSAQAKDFLLGDEITAEPLAQMNVAKNMDSVALNEVVVVGYGTQKKMDITGSVSKLKADDFAKSKQEKALDGRLAGQSNARIIAINIDLISGKVVSKENDEPLVGVQIKNTKNNSIAYTNESGDFKIKANVNDELIIQLIGFETEKINVKNRKNLAIELKNNTQTLAEVVINSPQTTAGPKYGWKAFRDYLEENAKLTTSEKGRVVVQFYIQSDGKLEDFSIQKGLSASADNKAVELIKNYSSWIGSSDGKSKKVKVTVRFK